MTELMIEPLCAGKRVLIVGSAPDYQFPCRSEYDVVIGANGGAAIAWRDLGGCDILCTTTHLFRAFPVSPAEKQTREDMRGLQVLSTWLDTKNGPFESEPFDIAQMYLGALNEVPMRNRNLVVIMATGDTKYDTWVSTGVWAACLARNSGASQIHLSGISCKDGHAGMEFDDAERHHTDTDIRVVRSLSERSNLVIHDSDLVKAVRSGTA